MSVGSELLMVTGFRCLLLRAFALPCQAKSENSAMLILRITRLPNGTQQSRLLAILHMLFAQCNQLSCASELRNVPPIITNRPTTASAIVGLLELTRLSCANRATTPMKRTDSRYTNSASSCSSDGCSAPAWMNSSVMRRASSSVNCLGGDFMK